MAPAQASLCMLALFGLAAVLAPRSAGASPEDAQRTAQKQLVPKILARCGMKRLEVEYDGASLRQDLEIKRDQTDGALVCNEPLRFLWKVCESDAGRRAVQEKKITRVVCRHAPAGAAEGSLVLERGVWTNAILRAEKGRYARLRRQAEATLGVAIPLEVDDPYYDQAWSDVRSQDNPVPDDATSYCLFDDRKRELDERPSYRGRRRVKCLKDGKVFIDLTLDGEKRTGLETYVSGDEVRVTHHQDGKRHGLERLERGGHPVFERMHERGEVVWSKEYHRDGPVREHRVNIGKERLAAWYDDKGQLQGLQCSPAAKGVAPFHDLCGFRGKRTQPLRAGGQAVRRVYESGYLVEEEVTAGDGRPGRHTRYRQGKPHGEERLYAPSGRPERRLFWKDGRKDGLETAYHEDGERVVEEKEWKDGRAVVERTRWLNGRVKREVRYGPHDIAERTDFHDNGQKAEEGVLVGCRWGLCPDGKWTTWDERGRKVAEVTWRAGVRHGPAAEWLEDGRTATLEYQDGAVRHRVERNAQGEILLDERYAEDGSRL